ncbi:MAG TPA: SRPBCC family protein [Chthoniobacteraceae bacterium]|jgi:uncharacterized membrane protein|nr:putative integral rane protein [Chthoniobacter sp.]HEV7869179.1 SRPBCC family protein [Chthoniobacteraceae bacterium]
MPLTYQPFSESPELKQVAKVLSINVSEPERTFSVYAGAVLALVGLARRSVGGLLLAALGGGLLYRGSTGHCDVYEALGINSRALNDAAGVPGNKGIKVVRTVTINRPRPEVYQFWRKLENLPAFMNHVERVETFDERRSHWKVKGPAGSSVEWDAEIINEHENELLAWQSLPGAEVQNAGSVWFEDAAGGGTRVKVALEFNPPGGAAGALVAKLFGEAPEQQMDEDLGKLKQHLEDSGQFARH